MKGWICIFVSILQLENHVILKILWYYNLSIPKEQKSQRSIDYNSSVHNPGKITNKIISFVLDIGLSAMHLET